MPITRHQAELIAQLAADIRPHGARRWDQPGILAALHRVQTLALADIAMAAFRAAADRAIDTPAPIGDTRSSAWRERIAEPVATKTEYCRIHGTALKAGTCPSCRADQLAGDQPTERRPGQRLPPEQVAAIVGELRDHAHPQHDQETP